MLNMKMCFANFHAAEVGSVSQCFNLCIRVIASENMLLHTSRNVERYGMLISTTEALEITL
jgi:hypothetical protein